LLFFGSFFLYSIAAAEQIDGTPECFNFLIFSINRPRAEKNTGFNRIPTMRRTNARFGKTLEKIERAPYPTRLHQRGMNSLTWGHFGDHLQSRYPKWDDNK